MCLDNVANEREAESGAANLSCVLAAAAKERVEDFVQLFVSDAHALVDNPDDDATSMSSCTEADCSMGVRVFDRIGEQVDDGFFEGI